jgi:hypothetical protein
MRAVHRAIAAAIGTRIWLERLEFAMLRFGKSREAALHIQRRYWNNPRRYSFFTLAKVVNSFTCT